MAQIGESIAVSVAKELVIECPFSHKDGPHNKKNYLTNNSSALGKNCGSGGDNFEVTFEVSKKQITFPAGVAAHHLIPGNESLKRATALLKYVKKGSEIKGDIGYNVNSNSNGIWLPGNYQWPSGDYGKWSKIVSTYKEGGYIQLKYAYACMDMKGRQFHDRHADYSRWIKMTLEKIRLQMLKMKSECDKCSKDKKPFNPPYQLVNKLNALSSRVRGKLMGSPKGWRLPFIVSRFALLYSLGHKPEDFS